MEPDARKKLMDELFAEREVLERRVAQREAEAARLASARDVEAAHRMNIEIQDLRARADAIGRRWSELQDDDIHDDGRGGIER